MTVYCVKCGKPNTAQASSCASCGIELKKPKKKGGRFKGTMMMTNPETFLSTEESQEDHADPPVSDAEPTPDTNPPPPNPSEPPINRPARGRFKQTMVGTPAVNTSDRRNQTTGRHGRHRAASPTTRRRSDRHKGPRRQLASRKGATATSKKKEAMVDRRRLSCAGGDRLLCYGHRGQLDYRARDHVPGR